MLLNKKRKISGAAIAMAAAGLFACANAQAKPETSAATGTTDLAHCYGVNTCGSHNDCKTGDNACAGKASCKGKGFVAMPTKACADVGGKVMDAWRGSIKTTDLSHCYNVNVCKGHNDCKSANNACAGHASCKGKGFVATPAKACADIGGNVDT
ncbi:MAG: hypothetical protein JKY66_09950 [Spongiibacteraceae bacterium]|nr:hypothetical protein [Spongiibacteraceae bacterium]